MEQDAAKYGRVELCQLLDVSRSGWYHHQSKANSRRRKEDEMLSQEIKPSSTKAVRPMGGDELLKCLPGKGSGVGRNGFCG